MSEKIKRVIKQEDKDLQQNLSEPAATRAPARIETDGQEQLKGSELFSFFTANIIKEGKVFTR